ncbi:MAG: isoamylase early set domain-containing protein [Verrucomicrobia bacterium]|nr:isoamylase early set domain-containing protein [Verrucomicrobiota bacterium]
MNPTKAPRKIAARKAVAGPESSGTVAVTFVHVDQRARQVVLSGEFNQWSAAATPMSRQGDGRWQATLELPPGRHSYKFVVDGRWISDPNACEQVADGFGASNSVIEVRL